MSMSSWEPLGASGTASDDELGRWLTLRDDVVFSANHQQEAGASSASSSSSSSLPPLLAFPRDWPGRVWGAKRWLKR